MHIQANHRKGLHFWRLFAKGSYLWAHASQNIERVCTSNEDSQRPRTFGHVLAETWKGFSLLAWICNGFQLLAKVRKGFAISGKLRQGFALWGTCSPKLGKGSHLWRKVAKGSHFWRRLAKGSPFWRRIAKGSHFLAHACQNLTRCSNLLNNPKKII